MYIQNALKTKLAGTSAITALVSNRIYYFDDVPQDVKNPYVVCQTISNVPQIAIDGAAGLNACRIQISIFDTNYKSCLDIESAIKTAINGFKGTMGGAGGVCVGLCVKDDSNDIEVTDNTIELCGIAVDYIIHYSD